MNNGGPKGTATNWNPTPYGNFLPCDSGECRAANLSARVDKATEEAKRIFGSVPGFKNASAWKWQGQPLVYVEFGPEGAKTVRDFYHPSNRATRQLKGINIALIVRDEERQQYGQGENGAFMAGRRYLAGMVADHFDTLSASANPAGAYGFRKADNSISPEDLKSFSSGRSRAEPGGDTVGVALKLAGNFELFSEFAAGGEGITRESLNRVLSIYSER